MSKRERREWEIRPRGKRRGGILTLLDPAENPYTDDLIDKAAPELRKQLLAARKFYAYMLAHPMDPRPMREADARAKEGLPEQKQLQIGVAVEEALKYGLKLGALAEKFGVDAVQGRKYVQQQIAASLGAAASRNMETAVRHSEWCAAMDARHQKNPDWKKSQLAEAVAKSYRAQDEDKPSAKTLKHIWEKPD